MCEKDINKIIEDINKLKNMYPETKSDTIMEIYLSGYERGRYYQEKKLTKNIDYYEMGKKAFLLKEFKDAVYYFNYALLNDKNNYKIHLYRGIARLEIGKYKSSIKDFDKTLEIDENNTDAKYYKGLAVSLQDTQNYEYFCKRRNEEKEFTEYIKQLRNLIASKIDFNNIYQGGECEITFKIDSNGQIIKRSFTQKAYDATLNTEIFDVFMSIPKYKTPPSSYKGQFLHFSVKIKDNHYSIKLTT